MQKYQNTVMAANGQVIAGATVTVQQYPSGANATIYSDNGVTQVSNVLTADVNGNFSFYAPNGRYQLAITGKNIVQALITDILLHDTPFELVSGDFAGQSVSYPQTTIYTPNSTQAGMYRLVVDLVCTASGSAGTVAASISSQNGAAVNNQVSSSIPLVIGSEMSQVFTFFAAANTPITVATSVIGASGTPQYTLKYRLEYLG